MSVVSEMLTQLIPGKSKTTPSNWVSFNAPCCHHNGHTADNRMRGGILESGDQISYHCFNCGFKASWQPGRPLSHKLRKLLQWLGASDDSITKLSFQVLRINEGVEIQNRIVGIPSFKSVSLPDNVRLITDDLCDENRYLIQVKDYMSSRKLRVDQGYNYYWSPSLSYRDRFIVPFLFKGETVGWVARTVHNNTKTKYLLEKQPGFVFNLDQQTDNKVFCIAAEGALDAIHVDGVGLLTNEISDQQSMLLNRLNREIIVVPDRDYAGRNLVERSIELGYSVSMPDWKLGIKDISDAVIEYGQLYTLYSIVSAAESSPLKIRLKEKRWFAKS
jgi:hypothetical protein